MLVCCLWADNLKAFNLSILILVLNWIDSRIVQERMLLDTFLTQILLNLLVLERLNCDLINHLYIFSSLDLGSDRIIFLSCLVVILIVVLNAKTISFLQESSWWVNLLASRHFPLWITSAQHGCLHICFRVLDANKRILIRISLVFLSGKTYDLELWSSLHIAWLRSLVMGWKSCDNCPLSRTTLLIRGDMGVVNPSRFLLRHFDRFWVLGWLSQLVLDYHEVVL